ncbi:hypothetical protein AG1IA_06323 [Rhizoctonia solani AG-1 IA]|uniref:Uncharacterized protein n=1 Tax=Thanatephorus cucumeris (strain AG1-IA) TaxID=983506 RepID=L8WS71_THACA|nr:hypothetical protein AG1IA_06323 [Rhizoctonia solani AG-1 IA]
MSLYQIILKHSNGVTIFDSLGCGSCDISHYINIIYISRSIMHSYSGIFKVAESGLSSSIWHLQSANSRPVRICSC